MIGLPSSTPLDDFLEGAGSATETGETLQQIGLVGSLGGLVIALGVIAFLAFVHAGRPAEVRRLLHVAGLAGAVALVGAVVEIAGVASVLDVRWLDALSDPAGSAAMMRLLAGLLIVLGLVDHAVPVRDGSTLAGADVVRWTPGASSAFGVAGAVVGAVSFAFDGHTTTEGSRVVHAIANIAHVSAGSVWVGGIVALVVVGAMRRRDGSGLGLLLVRFSSLATAALIAVAAAGVAMSVMILDEVGDLTGTPWGRLLIAKIVGVAIAVAIGGYHHFVVVPAVQRSPETTDHRGIGATLAVEVVVLVAVVALTSFLALASTN